MVYPIIYIYIPYAPWCWNIYQHLPQKTPSFVGKYTIHWAYGYIYIHTHILYMDYYCCQLCLPSSDIQWLDPLTGNCEVLAHGWGEQEQEGIGFHICLTYVYIYIHNMSDMSIHIYNHIYIYIYVIYTWHRYIYIMNYGFNYFAWSDIIGIMNDHDSSLGVETTWFPQAKLVGGLPSLTTRWLTFFNRFFFSGYQRNSTKVWRWQHRCARELSVFAIGREFFIGSKVRFDGLDSQGWYPHF